MAETKLIFIVFTGYNIYKPYITVLHNWACRLYILLSVKVCKVIDKSKTSWFFPIKYLTSRSTQSRSDHRHHSLLPNRKNMPWSQVAAKKRPRSEHHLWMLLSKTIFTTVKKTKLFTLKCGEQDVLQVVSSWTWPIDLNRRAAYGLNCETISITNRSRNY